MTDVRPETATNRSDPGPASIYLRGGFTLIELLVVVAIIALLVAILIPALETARAQAEAAVCLTHMRQVTFAIYYYAEHNNGWMRRRYYYPAQLEPENLDKQFWSECLWRQGFLDAPEVLVCPAYPPEEFEQNASYNPFVPTFGIRGGTSLDPVKWPSFDGDVRLSDLEQPSEYVILADSSYRPSYLAQQTYYWKTWWILGSKDLDYGRTMHLRHSGRANCGFPDSSVRPLDGTDLPRCGITAWWEEGD